MGSLIIILFFSQLAASQPASVSLGERDAGGCADLTLASRDGVQRPLRLPSDEVCVRDALIAHLEGAGKTHVVLTVTLRNDPAQRRQLFIYELAGGRLVPRYLGSGPRHLELLEVGRDTGHARDTLLLEVSDPQGQRSQLRCAFDGFPLLCRERAAAVEGKHG